MANNNLFIENKKNLFFSFSLTYHAYHLLLEYAM